MTELPSFAGRARTGDAPDAPYITVQHFPSGAGAARAADRAPGHSLGRPVGDFVLGVVTEGRGHAGSGPGVLRFEGTAGTPARGLMAFAPTRGDDDHAHDVAFGLLLVSIPRALFDALARGVGPARVADLERLRSRPFTDPLLEQQALALAVEISADGDGSAYVDHLANGLALRLLVLAGRAPSAPARTVGALSAGDFARVRATMEERLEDKIRLAELAKLAGMDVYRFTRAFKSRTGRSPYRFLIERRLERARRMLRLTDASIVDIASACGFSSQSHMTTAFSKGVGTSPARYRRQLRGCAGHTPA